MSAEKKCIRVARKTIIPALLFLGLVISSTAALSIESNQIDIHGFVSQGFIKTTANNYLVKSQPGSFEFNEVGLNFSTQLSDELRVGAQLLSRDLGVFGNNEWVLDWGFGDYRWKDWMGFRLGKIKMPLNLYNEVRDIDMVRTPILLPQGVYDETLRDMTQAFSGAEVYGSFPVGKIGSFDYEGYVGTLNIPATGGLGSYFSDIGLYDVTKMEVNDFFGGKVKWNTPVEGLVLGLSKQRLDTTITGTIKPELTPAFAQFLGAPWMVPALPIPGYPATPWAPMTMKTFFDMKSEFEFLEYTWKSLTFSAEKWRVLGHYDTDPVIPAAMGPSSPPNRNGAYVMASYRHNDFFEWSYYHSRFDDVVAKALQKDPEYYYNLDDDCFSVRYDAAENIVLKAEAHRMEGACLMLVRDNPGTRDNEWWMYALKSTVSF